MIANSTVASRRHINYDMNRLDKADDILHDCADDIRRQVRDDSEVTGSLAAAVMNFGPLRSFGNYWLTRLSIRKNACPAISAARSAPSTTSKVPLRRRHRAALQPLPGLPALVSPSAVTVHGKTVLPQDQYHHPT